jgi:hypothetical protein
MVVGGYAVAWYGHPRFTKDLDIFYKLEPENIQNLKRCLIQFGFSEEEFSAVLFKPGNIIKMGLEPVRIDLLNEIDGVTFEEAEPDLAVGNYDEVPVNFIGKASLIKNKRASNRLQDQADVEKLE